MLHASAVALGDRAVLILGASGSGKSGLALRLMALGATLVSDDRTVADASGGALHLSAPETLRGLVEARGVGILHAETVARARAVLAVDLDRVETARLPQLHEAEVCGIALPCLHKFEAPHFPAAILQYLKAGRRDPA